MNSRSVVATAHLDRTGWVSEISFAGAAESGLAAALMESNSDMVFLVDGSGCIVGANARALSEFGYRREDTDGRSLEVLLGSPAAELRGELVPDSIATSSAEPEAAGRDLAARDSKGNEFSIEIFLRSFTASGKAFVIVSCRRLDRFAARTQKDICALVDGTVDAAVSLIDATGRILTWNAGAARIYQMPAAEAIGKHVSILFSADEIAAREPERQLSAVNESSQSALAAAWRTGSEGKALWLEYNLKAMRDSSGRVYGYTRVARDLTTHKQAEDRLLEANQALIDAGSTFRVLVDSVTDYAIYMVDPAGRVLTWNAGAQRTNGYKASEVVGRHLSIFFTPEAVAAGIPAQELETAARDGRFETRDWRVRKGGERFWAVVTITAIRGAMGDLLGYAKVTRNMSESKNLEDSLADLNAELESRVAERTHQLESNLAELRIKNEEIEALVAIVSHDLSEKEVLLREVYHRVKNNLQVVQSLLKMGGRALRSSDARQAIETAVERVHVMAMVHEHLYQMPDLSGLTLSDYLHDVVEGAIASNSQQPDQVELEMEIGEIPVPMDLAIPFGLLANELVSNCLKHGLVGGRAGKISIEAKIIPGAVRFSVRDNGVGLPSDFNAAKCTSMGLKLAASLAHQLGGRLQFSSSGGCCVQADLARLSMPNEKTAPVETSAAPPPLPGVLAAEAAATKARSGGHADSFRSFS
jgi:PAS domain S-box-containing protein